MMHMGLINIATFAALIVNTVALIVVICQTRIAKQALTITKKSIDEAKTQRQLEILHNTKNINRLWKMHILSKV